MPTSDHPRSAAPAPGESRTQTYVITAALVIAAVLTYLLFGRSSDDPEPAGGATACTGPGIKVVTTPELEALVQDAVTDTGCRSIDVEAASSGTTFKLIASGKRVPDVWIPDSTWWATRLTAETQSKPNTITESLATSPVVIAGSGDELPASYAEALTDPRAILGDPTSSATAATALFAGLAGPDINKAVQTAVSLAQAQADGPAEPATDDQRVEAAQQSPDRFTITNEQRVLTRGPGLRMVAPDGSPELDYPLLLIDRGQRTGEIRATVEDLAAKLATPKRKRALVGAGFRVEGDEPIAGVQDLHAADVNYAELQQLVGRYQGLVTPTRALVVIDVSGSMDFDAGGKTRMELTQESAQAGLRLFPRSAAVGLWAFSQNLDGEKDYRSLLPIRRLDADTPEGDGRTSGYLAVRGLSDITGGGTGLYDTSLAAYQQMLSQYRPGAANAVVLLTDGANDDPGSITLPELITQLKKLRDPARPVRFVAIGISADADAAALKKIAQATGGQSYIARDPKDIAAVFAKAISERTG